MQALRWTSGMLMITDDRMAISLVQPEREFSSILIANWRVTASARSFEEISGNNYDVAPPGAKH